MPGPPAPVARYGVDAELADQGVLVTIAAYPNMTAGDVINLVWGSEWVFHVVGADEVGKSVTLPVTRGIIAAVGDGGEVPIDTKPDTAGLATRGFGGAVFPNGAGAGTPASGCFPDQPARTDA